MVSTMTRKIMKILQGNNRARASQLFFPHPISMFWSGFSCAPILHMLYWKRKIREDVKRFRVSFLAVRLFSKNLKNLNKGCLWDL